MLEFGVPVPLFHYGCLLGRLASCAPVLLWVNGRRLLAVPSSDGPLPGPAGPEGPSPQEPPSRLGFDGKNGSWIVIELNKPKLMRTRCCFLSSNYRLFKRIFVQIIELSDYSQVKHYGCSIKHLFFSAMDVFTSGGYPPWVEFVCEYGCVQELAWLRWMLAGMRNWARDGQSP